MCRLLSMDAWILEQPSVVPDKAAQPRAAETAEAGRRWYILHDGGQVLARHLSTNPDTRQAATAEGKQVLRLTEQFKTLFSLAVRLTESAGVDAVLLLEGTADWQRLRNMAGRRQAPGGGRYRRAACRGEGGRAWSPSAWTCPTAPSTKN